jgi:hypothetical protein
MIIKQRALFLQTAVETIVMNWIINNSDYNTRTWASCYKVKKEIIRGGKCGKKLSYASP